MPSNWPFLRILPRTPENEFNATRQSIAKIIAYWKHDHAWNSLPIRISSTSEFQSIFCQVTSSYHAMPKTGGRTECPFMDCCRNREAHKKLAIRKLTTMDNTANTENSYILVLCIFHSHFMHMKKLYGLVNEGEEGRHIQSCSTYP